MDDDKLYFNWDEVYAQSLKLADLIKAGGQHFDYMVVVPRGGYFVANIVARELDFEPVNLLHACVGSYDAGVNQRRDDFSVGEMPPAEKVRGKKLLIIDEVCESGGTLAFVDDYLRKNGATSTHSGVLHYKPANSKNDYKPDYFVGQTAKWIVYPWEKREYTANH